MERAAAPPRANLCAPPALTHLRRLTTEIGIWQHARGRDPDPAQGYSVDDVARALIVVNAAARLLPDATTKESSDLRTPTDLAEVFLRFCERVQERDGLFHNFVSAEGSPADTPLVGDAFGRTLWALGNAMAAGITADHRSRAGKLFRRAAAHVAPTSFVRTNAFLLLGVLEAVGTEDVPAWRSAAESLTDDLLQRFADHQDAGWRWCEDYLRYSNGVVPLALFRAGRAFADAEEERAADAVATAVQALEFLLEESQHGDVPAPIGNKGWYEKGGTKALYDQQPVDAADMVLACLEGWLATDDGTYRGAAERWLRWYEGGNIIGESLLEPDGAVHDGIDEGAVSQNCGAEATVTYLLARLRWAELCCPVGTEKSPRR